MVLCMQGRLHGYEGYAPEEIPRDPVYVIESAWRARAGADECVGGDQYTRFRSAILC